MKAIAFWFATVCAAAPLMVKSPDGRVQVSVALNSRSVPYYAVSFGGTPVILDSTVGLSIAGAQPWGDAWAWLRSATRKLDQTYVLAGSPVRAHCQEASVELQEAGPPHRRLNLVFRAYAEGVAFRYEIPEQEALSRFEIAAENTHFQFSGAHRVTLPRGLRRLSDDRQSRFADATIAHLVPDTEVDGIPAVIEMDEGPWLALLEARVQDYPGMLLTRVPYPLNRLRTLLTPLPNGSHYPEEPDLREYYFPPQPNNPKARVRTPFHSPWRVVLLGANRGELARNLVLVFHLNDPCALSDTSWIPPVRSMESVAVRVGGSGGAGMAASVDFAAAHKLNFAVLTGWSWADDITMPRGIDVAEAVRYARERGVRLFLTVPWAATARQMPDAFPLFQQWGIAGVRILSNGLADQPSVDFIRDAVALAARHRLLVELVGLPLNDGLSRTYPNLISPGPMLGPPSTAYFLSEW